LSETDRLSKSEPRPGRQVPLGNTGG